MTDYADMLNEHRGGFNETLGLTFVTATEDEVVATVEIGPHLLQPYGLVHGGVYCTMIETLCSVGAALSAMSRGQNTVGLENTTSFLHGAREGTLTGTATPLQRGRRTQVWQVDVTQDDRLVATGRVRMINLEEGAVIGDKVVGLDR